MLQVNFILNIKGVFISQYFFFCNALKYPILRCWICETVFYRFGSSAYRSNQWRYRGRCDAIQFCVDKRVFIVGFGLYGSSNGSSDYSARIELKKSNGGILLASNMQQFFRYYKLPYLTYDNFLERLTKSWIGNSIKRHV